MRDRHPKRVPIWLPYLQSIKETKKGIWHFEYNGGEVKTDLQSVSSIMIYGETDFSFSTKELDAIARKGVPIILHRRNLAQSIYITGGLRPDVDDVLSKQIIKRLQTRASSHVARQVLLAKMRNMQYLAKAKPLPQFAGVKRLRNIEAVHARAYWKEFFEQLGHPEWTRRSRNPASEALDASSKFLSGIILRWVTYHHLSPYHGFFHETTEYPALIYDLIEPYRGTFEQRLLKTFRECPEGRWTECAITTLKEMLNEQVYVPLTRQIVTRQELLHGVVLSLQHYLLGRQRKFLIPLEGKPQGGRPPKVSFLLYGRHAGKTDFWQKAHEASGDL